jgi:hypothetical protein
MNTKALSRLDGNIKRRKALCEYDPSITFHVAWQAVPVQGPNPSPQKGNVHVISPLARFDSIVCGQKKAMRLRRNVYLLVSYNQGVSRPPPMYKCV